MSSPDPLFDPENVSPEDEEQEAEEEIDGETVDRLWNETKENY